MTNNQPLDYKNTLRTVVKGIYDDYGVDGLKDMLIDFSPDEGMSLIAMSLGSRHPVYKEIQAWLLNLNR